MTWESFPWGTALSLGGLVAAVLLLAMDERNRRKFLTREDAEGMAKRIDREISDMHRAIERNAGLFVALDDRTGDLEETTSRLDERQSQHRERWSEQITALMDAVREVAQAQKETAMRMQDLALHLERLQRYDRRPDGGD